MNTPLNTSSPTLLDSIDPDVTQHLVNRRQAITRGATVSSGVVAALATGSIPVALAALSREAGAQTLSVQEVINFALMLEIFENEFYKAVLGTSTSATQNAAFAVVRALVPATVLPALRQIQKHEEQHVTFLRANGAQDAMNLTAASFDFTGGRGAGNGPFAQAVLNVGVLLAVAQGAEDTGVRAYKGQAPALMSNSVVLEAALRIHSVEARHAAKIRRIRRATGAPDTVRWSGYLRGTGSAAAGLNNITGLPAAATAAFDAIYAGEGNTTQAGIDLSSVSGVPSDIDRTAAAQMAFDEPLTRDQVRAIVQPFFIPTIP